MEARIKNLSMYKNNFKEATEEILSSINVGDVVESVKPLTAKGASFKNELLKSINNNTISLSTINRAVGESSKFYNDDPAIYEMGQNLLEGLKSNNYRAKLCLIYEAASSQKKNMYNDSVLSILSKLLAENEENITNSIMDGVLNGYRSFYGVDNIVRECLSENDKADVRQATLTQPISYVHESNGIKYFVAGNTIFETLNGVAKAVNDTPSAMFTKINMAVNFLCLESKDFEIKTPIGTYGVKEGIVYNKRVDENGNEKFAAYDNTEILIEKVDKDISNLGTSVVAVKEADNARTVLDSINTVAGYYNEIKQLENVYTFKNSTEKITIVGEAATVCITQSKHKQRGVYRFDNIIEACAEFQKLTGYDITNELSSIIDVHEGKLEYAEKQLLESKETMHRLDEREKHVREEMKKVQRGSDAWNKFDRVLGLIEEQKIKFGNS